MLELPEVITLSKQVNNALSGNNHAGIQCHQTA